MDFLKDNQRTFFVEFGICLASLGPIPEKNLLKPSDISASPERTGPLFTKVSLFIVVFLQS